MIGLAAAVLVALLLWWRTRKARQRRAVAALVTVMGSPNGSGHVAVSRRRWAGGRGWL